MESFDRADVGRLPLSRRQLLRGAAAGAGLILLDACTHSGRDTSQSALHEGSSHIQGSRARGTIRGQTRGGALEVPAGETLRFDPTADTTLELSGNLLVLGRLEMRPQPGVEHVLRFVDVDETAFVGGGMDPIVSDVGLWVMEDGVLDIEGTEKDAWNRLGKAETWTSHDDLVVAPMESGDFTSKPFTIGGDVPALGDRRAEVLNLTRSVRIEGTPSGRAHVFIRSMQPQSIRYATLRYLGPRQSGGDYTEGVLGRYGLHFHHAHDGSRGSVVQGVVVRDCGNHAFVPHMSHGITLRDCIAYEVFEEAYWWDPQDPTNDLVIDRCVAASVHHDPENHGYRLAGFTMGYGSNLALRRSVAFAIQGAKTSAGYVWPEAPSGVWTFKDNLAHNNVAAGIFVWQNVGDPQVIERFTGFNNGSAGVINGAYINSFHYRELDLRDQDTAIQLIASGRADPMGRPQSWVDVEGGALFVGQHQLSAEVPVLVKECSFPGGVTLSDADGEPGLLDFVGCDLAPSDFSVLALNPGTIVRVQGGSSNKAFELTSTGVRDISPFYPYGSTPLPTIEGPAKS